MVDLKQLVESYVTESFTDDFRGDVLGVPYAQVYVGHSATSKSLVTCVRQVSAENKSNSTCIAPAPQDEAMLPLELTLQAVNHINTISKDRRLEYDTRARYIILPGFATLQDGVGQLLGEFLKKTNAANTALGNIKQLLDRVRQY
jgi:hypothetical protein